MPNWRSQTVEDDPNLREPSPRAGLLWFRDVVQTGNMMAPKLSSRHFSTDSRTRGDRLGLVHKVRLLLYILLYILLFRS